MDSHLIYSVSDALKNKIIWIKVSADTEWMYFSGTNEVNMELVINTIDSHFSDNVLYVALTRKKSTIAAKKDIKETIDSLLGAENFLIWNADFKKAIEFNKIGTLRCGELKK